MNTNNVPRTHDNAPSTHTEYKKETVYKEIENFFEEDSGMTTIEYAMGALVAAALAGALYAVVSSGAVSSAFESLITNALTQSPGR